MSFLYAYICMYTYMCAYMNNYEVNQSVTDDGVASDIYLTLTIFSILLQSLIISVNMI